MPGLKLEGFVPALAALGNFDGTDYAVPSANNTIALYYNKDMLDAAGVDPADDLGGAARRRQEADPRRYLRLGLSGNQQRTGRLPHVDVRLVERGLVRQAKLARDRGGIAFLRDLVKDGSVSKSVVTFAIDDARDQFVSGRAAMMVGGSWLLPQLDPHPDLHYGVVPLPTPKAGEQVKVPTGGELWVDFRHRQQGRGQEHARVPVFARRAARLRGGTQQCAGAGSRCGDKFNADLPRMAPFVKSLAGAVSRTAVLGTKYPKYSQAYADAMQAILIGQKDPQPALDEAQASAESGM